MHNPVPGNPAEIELVNFSGKHILIADDEPINIMLIAKLLTAKGATVSKAHNGNEALEILTGGTKPDLVILDLKMPGLDGLMTLEKIKNDYPGLTVLAFTASFLDAAEERSLIRRGFYATLPKNFKPDDFYSRINAALKANKN